MNKKSQKCGLSKLCPYKEFTITAPWLMIAVTGKYVFKIAFVTIKLPG